MEPTLSPLTLQLISLLANTGAMGILIYLVVFSFPRLTTLIVKMLTAERRICEARNAQMVGLLVETVLLLQTSGPDRERRVQRLTETIARIHEAAEKQQADKES